MKLQIDFSEFYEFADSLKDTGKLENALKRVTKEISKELLERIKNFTPRDKTGKLINGWNGNSFLVKSVDNGYEVEIVNTAEYAQWVNDGHRVKNRKEGEYLRVYNRKKVKTPHKWQKPVSDYYVYGHFFVERGIIQLAESTELELIILRELEKWWVSM